MRFGISTPMLYVCMRLQSEQRQLLSRVGDLQDEVARLKEELERAAEERDMLRNAHRILSITMGSMALHKTPSRKKNADRTPRDSSATPARLATTPRACPQGGTASTVELPSFN